jgi:hypothetical protein
MNLLELLATNPDYATLKTKGLLFTPELAETLEDIQATLGDRRVVVQAILTASGDYTLCADVLTEIGPGGLYHAGFGAIPTELLALVQVEDWDDIVTSIVGAE